jgi:hypothetical protein
MAWWAWHEFNDTTFAGTEKSIVRRETLALGSVHISNAIIWDFF